MNDIVFQPARKLARLLRTRKLSTVEVMKAFIAQVERVKACVVLRDPSQAGVAMQEASVAL